MWHPYVTMLAVCGLHLRVAIWNERGRVRISLHLCVHMIHHQGYVV